MPLAAQAATGSGFNPGPQDIGSGSGSGTVHTSLPASGKYTFLVELKTDSTSEVFASNKRARGAAAARTTAKAQVPKIESAQKKLVAALPSKTSVVYKTATLMAGVAVRTDVKNFDVLTALPNVEAVYPIAPKSFDNSYAVPLQGAPAVWQGDGSIGADQTIAIIDTGIDYTHANFGGPGTVEAYTEAHEAEASDADPALYPSTKVVGGFDLAGDAYNADPASEAYSPTPVPDNNPLDCQGHGSHVAGSAAGYGENADGTTYEGTYNASTPFDDLEIGPGMAPQAKLYAYRVFGCDGSTDLVTAALDLAADPNSDGDPSDHVDVVNMSLGSDFGSPQDGDSAAANAAVALGITVAVSSGNSGDVTDVGGSPGNADSVITVANSQDASSVIDGATVIIDGGSPLNFGVSRSVAYDWQADPDLVGTVVLPAAGTDPTACTAIPASTYDSDEIPLITWTQEALECGSVARSANLVAAGAGGFIFANSGETFDAGITGSAVIPGVLMVKSGADAIRDALEAGDGVTVSGTTIATVTQDFPEDNDKVNPSSSRGSHAKGNLKPDVAAVGTSVFSTASGTGDEGESLTGTSMAAPMVAGLSALVGSAHPDWTPAQIKAAIVNTAGQDILVNGSAATDPGATYAPARVGSGRIEAEAAVDNEVLAYSTDNPGVASISFGPLEITEATTIDQEITVENTGDSAVSYDTSYDAITTVPGAKYTVSPATVTVAAGATATVTVSFVVTSAAALKKSVDPTVGTIDSLTGLPREYLAEASGRVILEPTTGDAPLLRVPVYAAPRPAAEMTQADSLAVSEAQSSVALELSGKDVSTGLTTAEPSDNIVSLAAGFELQATSGTSPQCATGIVTNCYRLPDEKAADIKAVGYTSDFPQFGTAAESLAYFAISTQSPVATPASRTYIQIDIDTNGDGTPDAYVYNDRVVSGVDYTDVFVSTLLRADGVVLDQQLLNGRFGDLDTAAYDSDVLVLPVSLAALATLGVSESDPRISYGVEGYTNTSDQPIDSIGVGASGNLTGDALSADLYAPGIQVLDAAGEGPLVADRPGELTVTRDVDSYEADGGEGVLMVHFHNKIGDKDQVVKFAAQPQSIAFTSTPPTPSVVGTTYTVAATGGASGNPVLFSSTTGSVCSVSGTTVTLLAPGECTIKADQAGNGDFEAAPAVTQSVTVTAATTPTNPPTNLPAGTVVNTVAPTFTGTPLIGKTLSAKPGSWTPATGLAFTYQWTLNGAPVAAATSATYKLPSSALGKKVGVTVTATAGAVATAASSKASTVKAASTTKVKLSDPTITTKAKAKAIVTVKADGSGKETGTVIVHYGSKTKKDVMHTSDKGRIVVTLPKLKKGTYKVWAEFRGNSTVAADTSVKKNLKVRTAK